ERLDVAEIRKRVKRTRVLGSYRLPAAQIDAERIEGPNAVLGKHCNASGSVVLVFGQGMQLRQNQWCGHDRSSKMHAERDSVSRRRPWRVGIPVGVRLH